MRVAVVIETVDWGSGFLFEPPARALESKVKTEKIFSEVSRDWAADSSPTGIRNSPKPIGIGRTRAVQWL